MEEPTLRLAAALKAPPGPRDTTLHLVATGVDACDSGDHEAVDVTVAETETEIVVEAGLRIDDQPFCEIRTASDDFVVELDRPLGARRVIDGSKGERSVIWSPQRRKEVLARREVTSSDADRFMRSRFPGGEEIECGGSGPVIFLCTLYAPSLGKRVEFYVEVGRAGKELTALAGDYAAVRAREALRHPPKRSPCLVHSEPQRRPQPPGCSVSDATRGA